MLNRPIKIIEFIISLIPIIGSILGVYLTLRDNDTKTELRLKFLEDSQARIERTMQSNYEKLDLKMSNIQDSQTLLRILIENKQNRIGN